MTKNFAYCILHYKHSVCLTELINVGILFYFPDDNLLKFVVGDLRRVKKIYQNVSIQLLKEYTTSIEKNAIKYCDIKFDSFEKFINEYILINDAAGLIFSGPSKVINVFPNNDAAIEGLSNILLPKLNK